MKGYTVVLAFLLIMPTQVLADDEFWGTTSPAEDEEVPNSSVIAVTGWGTINSTFVIKIYVNGVLTQNHAGQVSPEHNIVENVDSPSATNIWTNTSGNTSGSYKLLVNNAVVSERDLVFTNGVGEA